MPTFATPTVPPALTSSGTSGGGDTSWFIHEQTLGFSWTVEQCSQVGSTGAVASSLFVQGNVAVNEYITSSFQFSSAETTWHTLSGIGYEADTGQIQEGTGYVYTLSPGYYRRRQAVDDVGSGCTGNGSFSIDPAQLDMMSVLSYAKIYASIPANGGCQEFDSWLIKY